MSKCGPLPTNALALTHLYHWNFFNQWVKGWGFLDGFWRLCYLMWLLEYLWSVLLGLLDLAGHLVQAGLQQMRGLRAHVDSFTVPLHSPNGRHLPAIRAVQGDCLWHMRNMDFGRWKGLRAEIDSFTVSLHSPNGRQLTVSSLRKMDSRR